MRTLCLAVRKLDSHFFRAWKKRHHDAAVSLDHREERLEAVYNEIETDMDLLGNIFFHTSSRNLSTFLRRKILTAKVSCSTLM